MNSLETLLTKPLFQALGWALVHFIWQGVLVALLYAGLATLLRRRAASLRYSVACAAMLLMLALPAATVFVIQQSSTPTQNESGARQAAAPSQTAAAILVDGHRQALANEVSTPTAGAYVTQSVPTAQSRTPVEGAASASFWRPWAKERFTRLMPWLVAIWFAGVLFLSLRFLGGLVVTRRLKRLQTSPLLEQWQAKLAALCQQLRVSRPVRLCESVLVEVPTVIGWLRPVILVPASALTGLSPAQLEALLAHELGHIKRYDYLVNLLQTAVETLLFYHPAVWWLSSQIRQEREHCCDDLAVETCGNVLVYARALAELEQLRGVAPQLAVAASGGVLLRRIQRLVGNPARPSHRFESWLAGVIALATACCLFAGAQTTMLSGAVTNAANTPSTSASVAQTANADSNRPAQAAKSKASDASRDALTEESGEQNAVAAESLNDNAAEAQAVAQSDQQDEPGGDFINALTAEGYTKLSADELIALRSRGVTPAFIHEMNAVFNQKLAADQLVAFKVHGITPQFVSELKAAGLSRLSPDILVAFSVHGVTPQFVADWKAIGYDHLAEDELVAFRIHNVTPEFVRELKELGFNQPSPDELVAFRIHGVSPEFVRTMRGTVRGNLSAEEFVAFSIHGVTPEFVRELSAVGYDNLPAEILVAFRIHGVSPNIIKSIQALGFKPSAEQLVAMRIHGVTPEYIESVKSRGFKDATLEQLIELRRLNIMPGPRKQ